MQIYLRGTTLGTTFDSTLTLGDMINLHFNNSSKSKQPLDRFAMDVFLEITNNKDGMFQISIDDGDGDVWKYTISVDCDRVKEVNQITEN